MKFNPVTVALLVVFFYPILKGFLFAFSSHNLKLDLQDVNKNVSFVISLFGGTFYGKNIFIQHEKGIYRQIYNVIPNSITSYINSNKYIVYFIIIPLLIYVIYNLIFFLLQVINNVTLYPLLDGIEDSLRDKNTMFKRIMGGLFQFPKSVSYVLIISFLLNFISIFKINNKLNQYAEASVPYKTICKQIIIPVTNSKIAKQLPNILDNSFKIVVKESNAGDRETGTPSSNTIVYYNGVTLEEGVRSNSAIDALAGRLGNNSTTTRGKAKLIYNWIGSNIGYDYNKADRVLQNDFNVQSGAIPTFNSGKGICFDYSCLYVAMSRADNIKVRLITGEGFNGVSWVSHAWNQVYIPEESRWINVDTTFYRGGNYFDSKRFDLDHRDAKIAGQW
ncbi:MAG: transglutaminase domain protein [Clostridiaceae bacterium]|nr:transglutaminase domain protein [Clostridiaceae bacterium]